ncbi:beta-carotene hydroxylase [Aurantimonas aggregata]|uniref:beta-carotene hydroxylase n=1 Tax=Aurantimonas aggregata TaxID=2047720 RepID=UPI0019425751|nr:beta-carotene hydroxylase [Aurantimonas aggregata]
METTDWPVLAAIPFAVFLGMEVFAWAAPQYIMHSWGWGWHHSHHEEREGWFEKNDLYAVAFAAFAISLFVVASYGYLIVGAVATGITLYGAFHFIVHDGLVHQRGPFRHIPHKGLRQTLGAGTSAAPDGQGQGRGGSFGFR